MIINVLVFTVCLLIALVTSTSAYVSNLNSAARVISFIDERDHSSQMTLMINQEIQSQGGFSMILSKAKLDNPSLTTTSQYQTALLQSLNKIVEEQSVQATSVKFYKFVGGANNASTLTDKSGSSEVGDIDAAIAHFESKAPMNPSSPNYGNSNFDVVLPR